MKGHFCFWNIQGNTPDFHSRAICFQHRFSQCWIPLPHGAEWNSIWALAYKQNTRFIPVINQILQCQGMFCTSHCNRIRKLRYPVFTKSYGFDFQLKVYSIYILQQKIKTVIAHTYFRAKQSVVYKHGQFLFHQRFFNKLVRQWWDQWDQLTIMIDHYSGISGFSLWVLRCRSN